ncbi:conserved hypothetical protein [Serratia proteamaculans]|uniref:hypothetical protein n=1 Tax=Serratia TaxID=613 RepID=UPI0009F7B19F|nr:MULTISPECIES: hypothetical protein [Serratia]SMB37125.1 conserved hypothetical protein [Serratia proteamaculans]
MSQTFDINLTKGQVNALEAMADMSGMTTDQFVTYVLKKEIVQFIEWYNKRFNINN